MEDNRTTTASELLLLDRFKNLFKRKRKVKAGDLGIYEQTLSFTSIGHSSRGVYYDVFVKVKAVEVYDDLVEIEVIDVTISDSVSEDTCNLIKHENLKYLNPNKVKWQKKYN